MAYGRRAYFGLYLKNRVYRLRAYIAEEYRGRTTRSQPLSQHYTDIRKHCRPLCRPPLHMSGCKGSQMSRYQEYPSQNCARRPIHHLSYHPPRGSYVSLTIRHLIELTRFRGFGSRIRLLGTGRLQLGYLRSEARLISKVNHWHRLKPATIHGVMQPVHP